MCGAHDCASHRGRQMLGERPLRRGISSKAGLLMLSCLGKAPKTLRHWGACFSVTVRFWSLESCKVSLIFFKRLNVQDQLSSARFVILKELCTAQCRVGIMPLSWPFMKPSKLADSLVKAMSWLFHGFWKDISNICQRSFKRLAELMALSRFQGSNRDD